MAPQHHRRGPLARPGRGVASNILPKTGGIRLLDKRQGGAPATTSNASQLVSGKEAQSLHRRMFFPQSGHNGPVPRILTTPATTDIDDQLYRLLALVCRAYVSPWFAKISRERTFYLEIVRIASHVFREVETRILDDGKLDKTDLLCRALPSLLMRHVHDYRQAKDSMHSAYSAGCLQSRKGLVPSDLQAMFHSLQPHAAISLGAGNHTLSSSAEKLPACIDADYVRGLVDALLAAFLPVEDYQAETERAVVTEVIVGIVLAGIFNKCSQPWFIYGLIAKVLEDRPRLHSKSTTDDDAKLLKAPSPLLTRMLEACASVSFLFYRMTTAFAYLSWLTTLAMLTPFYRSNFAREQRQRQRPRPRPTKGLCAAPIGLAEDVLQCHNAGSAVVAHAFWIARSACAIAGPLLDKIIVHFLYTRIFTASTVSLILDQAERALFPLPGGFPAPSPPDPSLIEQEAIKAKAYAALESRIPGEQVCAHVDLSRLTHHAQTGLLLMPILVATPNHRLQRLLKAY
ncbi:hypothetical protein EMMF5_005802 [Cystobasidiomycetes sp. EMM_F5]